MEEKQKLELNDDELEGVSGGGLDMPSVYLSPDTGHMPPGTGPCDPEYPPYDPEYPPCDTYITGITMLTEQKKTP